MLGRVQVITSLKNSMLGRVQVISSLKNSMLGCVHSTLLIHIVCRRGDCNMYCMTSYIMYVYYTYITYVYYTYDELEESVTDKHCYYKI